MAASVSLGAKKITSAGGTEKKWALVGSACSLVLAAGCAVAATLLLLALRFTTKSMAGRWNRFREGAALWQLFVLDELVDPDLSDLDYIESIRTDYPNDFAHIPRRNFRNNYRRYAALYLTAMNRNGARGRAANPGRGFPRRGGPAVRGGPGRGNVGAGARRGSVPPLPDPMHTGTRS